MTSPDSLDSVDLVPPSVILRIRELVRQGRYVLTPHAQKEAAADDLDVLDVEAAILTGEVKRVQQDSRGRKYVIVGKATDLATRVAVVARFTSHQSFLIITVYEIYEERG